MGVWQRGQQADSIHSNLRVISAGGKCSSGPGGTVRDPVSHANGATTFVHVREYVYAYSTKSLSIACSMPAIKMNMQRIKDVLTEPLAYLTNL